MALAGAAKRGGGVRGRGRYRSSACAVGRSSDGADDAAGGGGGGAGCVNEGWGGFGFPPAKETCGDEGGIPYDARRRSRSGLRKWWEGGRWDYKKAKTEKRGRENGKKRGLTPISAPPRQHPPEAGSSQPAQHDAAQPQQLRGQRPELAAGGERAAMARWAEPEKEQPIHRPEHLLTMTAAADARLCVAAAVAQLPARPSTALSCTAQPPAQAPPTMSTTMQTTARPPLY